MEQRILGINEVVKRCESLYNTLGLKNVLHLPGKRIDVADIPCLLIKEGDDKIIKYAGRQYSYPCFRTLDVIIECWDYSTGNVRNAYLETRKAILEGEGELLPDINVTIKEKKTIGPLNYDIPNVEGMMVVFEMSYFDGGP